MQAKRLEREGHERGRCAENRIQVAGVATGRVGAGRVALDQRNARAGSRELVRGAAAEDAAAYDDDLHRSSGRVARSSIAWRRPPAAVRRECARAADLTDLRCVVNDVDTAPQRSAERDVARVQNFPSGRSRHRSDRSCP